ncbi:MAG: thioredoxin domain-containing protein [Thermoplasmata archaeon]|nr:MAG: thioredoxin domain-containing protein [Thermoplasmata archaeon]
MPFQMTKSKPNALIFEKSPYLLQHAHNPVNWYPWADEAFEKAKKEDKPIFLSIGYSTCHWCHVMERESFTDEEVAELLNKDFVSIKVDREERPDIDGVYMAVCQLMTGSGGWPLTIIMTPDKKPFFAATYIPRKRRFNMMGMLELLPKITEMWTQDRERLLSSSEEITAALKQFSEGGGKKALDESILTEAYEALVLNYDDQYGGFGGAPKFPTPHNLLFLLRFHKRTGKDRALRVVEKTLQAMRHGGMWDHVGFGFHRYSTDKYWLVPHFEKMLYDQAMLAMAYTEAYQVTGKAEYRETAQQILEYVLRTMTSINGGFYSAEDADSEGEEGRFYVWDEDELRGILGNGADIAIRVFNVSKEGNFIEEAGGRRTGKNILHPKKPLSNIAKELDMSPGEMAERIDEARMRLFEAREKRAHPGKDDKILCDWNGLMIAAMAKASRVFDEPRFLAAAEEAVDFICTNMKNKDGRLFHRFREGEAAISGFLDDYAFLVWGLLELYEASLDVRYLKQALELNTYLITHFWDSENKGFYSTSDEGEQLLVRRKESYDGAIPSGNSVAAMNMLRLARITAKTGLETRAEEAASTFSRGIINSPGSHSYFMCALDFAFGPSYEVVIVGNPESDDTKAMLNAQWKAYAPNKILLFRNTETGTFELDSLSPYTASMTAIDGRATAYVCRNFACELPTTEIDKMLGMLDFGEKP